jgi:D-arabinose 1-dehydrogenase-like Zn-dependent alcohol dehydrogenase
MVFGQALPFTGSHEPAGEVVALGAEATRHGDFKIGSRVAAVNTARWCGECPECKYHDPRYCAKQHMIGLVGTDGAFAEYCIVDASRAALIPESMSYEQVHRPLRLLSISLTIQAAPMSCAGVTAYSAIKRANLQPGDVISINS